MLLIGLLQETADEELWIIAPARLKQYAQKYQGLLMFHFLVTNSPILLQNNEVSLRKYILSSGMMSHFLNPLMAIWRAAILANAFPINSLTWLKERRTLWGVWTSMFQLSESNIS